MRNIAAKYNIPFPTVRDRAKREEWQSSKNALRDKIVSVTSQKAIEAASSVAEDNATIAAQIKHELLTRLLYEVRNLPKEGTIGSESAVNVVEWGRNKKGDKQRIEKTKVQKLKDLTGAYKDLTDDMPKEQSNPALERLDQMLAEVKKIALDS